LPHRYVKEVWESAQQGARWIQKLHLFSSRRTREFAPASVQTITAEEEARLRPTWAPNVALHVALQADLPTVAVEAGALRQVLVQVLDNAREAIAGQGVVTITARVTDLTDADCQELLGGAVPGPYVEVTVTDTGMGLSPEARQRLFSNLFHSTKVRHRGLGLAMVYGVLLAARGGLRFGPDPAQGTAVRLFLPVAAPLVSKPAPPRVTKQRVLVVDDDPLILRFIATILESAGYRVQVAAGGAEALALYTTAAEPFRLVLSDVVMPSMNGVELAQRLRQHDPNVNLLFVSSEVPASPQVDGQIPPGFLPKPFRADTLVQAVGCALERGRGTAPLGQTV
jgi:CheY-like chemotaxis protein